MKDKRPTMSDVRPMGTIKEKSLSQENKMARSVGGKVQPGSGSSMYAKGDVKHSDFLIECKRTDKKSLRVQNSWLVKITEEAFAKHKYPALHMEMEINTSMTESDWVAVPLSVFVKLIGEKDV